MKVFLTGAAGFIGFHTAKKLLESGCEVYGYDSMNDYYAPEYKWARLTQLKEFNGFRFTQGLLEDSDQLKKSWLEFGPTHTIHLAAQAGVRYSNINPGAYVTSNLAGFQNILELVRHHPVENFIYASSSSVYGNRVETPFKESSPVDNPASIYAATKLSNEIMAKTYCNLYDIPATGLRFFTAFGPFSRPDMAIFKFINLMKHRKPIPVYNEGHLSRDFTYIDDIVSGILLALRRAERNEIYNLGFGNPVKLLTLIETLESVSGIKANFEMLPMQQGDVAITYADITKSRTKLGYNPKTNLRDGIEKFYTWYKDYHQDRTRVSPSRASRPQSRPPS